MASPTLDDIFPIPGPRVSSLAPERWSGVTAASTAALIETVKADYEKFHVFFNDKHFHNHTTHHLFALWALGGDADVIRAAYEHNAEEQRPAFESPNVVESANWKEYLGDDRYYQGYLEFFTTAVRTSGVEATLEKYLMSDDANLTIDGKTEGGPLMLVRFVDALVHPMIHTGHGCEFGMPGMVAEGLAWTAVHKARNGPLLPPSVFVQTPAKVAATSNGIVFNMTSVFRSLSFGPSSSVEAKAASVPTLHPKFTPTGTGPHAFTILARVIKDPLLAPSEKEIYGDLDDLAASDRDERAEERRKRTVEFAEEWAAGVDLTPSDALHQKIEELAWMNALVYGAGGFSAKKGADFYADFFTMHCVTSSLFLPSILHHLQPASQTRLLRAYFAICLSYYITRGRPALDLRAFFAEPVPPLEVSGTHPTPSKDALKPKSAGVEHSQNAWHAVLQSTLLHPEAHVSKCERVLAHWAQLYGKRPRGYWAALAEGSDGLEGAEDMDGSLFIRAGALTLSKVGWVREGQDAVFWNQ